MGSDRHYPEEAPARQAAVADFWIDRTPVTNRQFRKFVNETGHVTLAELPPDAKDYPGALPEMLKAGSLIFASPRGPVDLRDWSQWWQFKFGANWRRPYGPRSSISGLDDHPVVHIAYRDAEAYAQWAGKRSRRKPNLNLPPAADWKTRNSPGATSSSHPANGWPTSGRGDFSYENSLERRLSRRRSRWLPFRPMVTASTTWQAMSGNGAPTGSRRSAMRMGCRQTSLCIPNGRERRYPLLRMLLDHQLHRVEKLRVSLCRQIA